VCGLPSTRNTRVDSHFSASGMPHIARGMAVACGMARRTRPRSSSRCLLGGIKVLLLSLAPARRGVGKRRGPRRADRSEHERQPRHNKATVLTFVGRLLDAFDKDVSGVSSLQH
jgi:hypothetical protein